MKLFLTVPFLLLLFNAVSTVGFGQQTTCNCERTANSSRPSSVTCTSGCSTFRAKNNCVMSCRSGLIDTPLTLTLLKKTGKEIASILSGHTQKRIEFRPYTRNTRDRYDLEIKGDDIWNVLEFLDKFGNVKVDGVDFSSIRKLRREIRIGELGDDRWSRQSEDIP